MWPYKNSLHCERNIIREKQFNFSFLKKVTVIVTLIQLNSGHHPGQLNSKEHKLSQKNNVTYSELPEQVFVFT